MASSGIGRPSAFLYLSEALMGSAADAVALAGFAPADKAEGASIALVEIGVTGYLKVLDALLDEGIRTIVIGKDPDDFVTVGLEAAGVWRVLRTDQFFDDPAKVLPLIA